jgi:hypothetical protein
MPPSALAGKRAPHAATNICGSALHMHEGCISFEKARIFGHANLGKVVEAGQAIDRKKPTPSASPLTLAAASVKIARAAVPAPASLATPAPPAPPSASPKLAPAEVAKPSGRPSGHIGVVGTIIPQRSRAHDNLAKEGEMAFNVGALWFKGQKIRADQANVKA